jgi:hypothetical protein
MEHRSQEIAKNLKKESFINQLETSGVKVNALKESFDKKQLFKTVEK